MEILRSENTVPRLLTLSLIELSKNNYWRKNRTRFEIRLQENIRESLPAPLYAEYEYVRTIWTDATKALKNHILHEARRECIDPWDTARHVAWYNREYKEERGLWTLVCGVYEGDERLRTWLQLQLKYDKTVDFYKHW
jgi:hypothetical protein